MPQIKAISVSNKKGIPKTNCPEAEFIVDQGIAEDAHAAPGKRQVSLLAQESIKKMQDLGLTVSAGSFAENITTEGIILPTLPIGTRLQLGKKVILQVSQIGKTCHDRCQIYYQAGDCVMPKEGIFGMVLVGGQVKVGDPITIISAEQQNEQKSG